MGATTPTGPVSLRTRFLSPNVLLRLPDDFTKASEGFLRVSSVTLAKSVKRMDTGRTGVPSPPVPGPVGFSAIELGRGNLDHPKHPDADICFNQTSGPRMGLMIKHMLNVVPAMKPLVLVLKYFMQQRSLNVTFKGGVGSFLLQLMVISSIQNHQYPISGPKPLDSFCRIN